MKIQTNIFCGHFAKDMGWFRIFGYGVAWKDLRKHQQLFSERNGYVRTWRVGNDQLKELTGWNKY